MPDLPRLPITQVPADHRFVIKRLQESNYFQALEGIYLVGKEPNLSF